MMSFPPLCSRHVAAILASSNPPSARFAFATLSLSEGTSSDAVAASG